MQTNDQERIARLFFGIARLVHGEVKRQCGDCPLSRMQIQALLCVHETKQPLMHTVATCLSITPPSATMLVNGLIRLHLVVRKTDKNDRRACHLAITPKGDRLLKQRFVHIGKSIEKILEPLSAKERKQLIHLIEQTSAAHSR
jgi:DNA-binding MarR family transcriptional regulator